MKKITRTIFLLIIFTAVAVLPAQAQHAEELYSPYFLGLGPQSTSLEAPFAVAFNPAAAGLEQRIRLELNYTGLVGLAGNPGWGSSINAGLTLPTNFGVLTFSGNYIGSPFTDVDLGSQGGARIVFSKDLLPNFLVGIGVSAVFGSVNGTDDWGLGADLGVIHQIGKVLFLEDFTWGLAMRNMGKQCSDSAYFPAAFTPALGLSFKMIKTDPFSLGVHVDLSFPSFNNLLFFGALDIGILNTITLRAAYRLDVNELTSLPGRFPVTFGLSVNFRIDLESEQFLTDRGWGTSDMRVDVAVAPLQNDTIAAGAGVNIALGMRDEKGPVISIKPVKPDGQAADDDTLYVSPNLDGTQDSLELPISITDERYVKGYKLVIKDDKGNVVRTIENKELRDENLDLDNIFNRLAYVKTGVAIPPSITWDGKNETGTVVADGAYTYELEAWDDNGNASTSEPARVVIDTTPPTASVGASYTIFSPNGDGNKDTLPLVLSGSAEDTWKAEVRDENDKVVNTFEWKGQPESFGWDGKGKDGNLLADGVYSVQVSSTDRAGNGVVKKFDNIIINTEATPIFITVDTESFSPNADRIADTIGCNIVLGNNEGIKSWALEFVHETNGVLRTITGTLMGPKVSWDGRKDDGSTADEGLFTARLTVEYVKGDKPVASSKAFRLDISGPQTDISFNPEPFSPDNDGVEDELSINTKIDEPSGIESWSMEIKDPTGVHFTGFSGRGKPSASIVWDGISDTGELVQAASDYRLVLNITDTVGNKTTLEKTIMVDVLVIRDGDKLYIRVPSITFKPDTADYKTVAKEALDKNMWTIERLAIIFKKYRSYQIQIEGHAVSVYWKDPKRMEKEQIEELIPLSTKRAEAIKQALVALGIDAARISTVGVGASRPIVPFSDEKNVWKDRRVEFILLK